MRDDGKHELLTVYQRIGIADRIELDAAPALRVDGFAGDTLVRGALEALAARAGVEPRWRVRIEKRMPVAAGIGGGSSDAATALRLANETLAEPLPPEELHELAAALGADVPFFLADGPQLGSGDGSRARAARPAAGLLGRCSCSRAASVKPSTRDVYAAFDRRGGEAGLEERRARAARRARARPSGRATSPRCRRTTSRRSPLAGRARARSEPSAPTSPAPVPRSTGSSTTAAAAKAAQRALKRAGRTWLTAPAWYG